MACLPTTQECEFPQEKDANDRSPRQSSLCNQTSNMNPAYNYPTQEECKVEYAVKESLSETTDITVEKTRDDTNALQGNHKEDQQEVVSQQEGLQVISEEEKQEAIQHQCSTEKVVDKEPQLVEYDDASIPTIDGTEYPPGGHTAHGYTDSVSSKDAFTQEESIACSYTDRDIRIDDGVRTTVDQQEKDDNIHLEQNAHAPELREGCLSQEHNTAHPSVTFATPLEEYFGYTVGLNPADQTSEPTLECGSTDCETSMYDADENKFPDWKIPSSLDVALGKWSNIESSETGHHHATIEEFLKENDHSVEKCHENSSCSSLPHTRCTVAGRAVSQQYGTHIESKLREESESERSLKYDAFPIVYRAPSELLDANLDDYITGTAIKKCIDNNEGWTYGGPQEDRVSSDMNCYALSSSPTESTKLSSNDKVSLQPEVKQVIASVVQQVMAAMSPEEDVIMRQHSPLNKDIRENLLNSLCSESYHTESVSEEATEKIKDLSLNATTDTVTEHSASPIPQDDQVSECTKQEAGQTALADVLVSSSQEQGYSHCSQVRSASTPLHQLHTHQTGDNVLEMENIECRSEPLKSSRDSGKLDVEELERDTRQENHEKLSPDFITAGTSVKEKNNNKVLPKTEQVDTLLGQEDKMKGKVETYERDLEGVVTPEKQRDLDGTCVPDGDINSSQTLFHSLTSHNSPKNLREGYSDSCLKKHFEPADNQVSGCSKQESGQREMDAIACESDPLTMSREPDILDVEVSHTDHEQISPDSTKEEANIDKNNDEVVQKIGRLNLLLSQEDMFENDPDDYSRAPSIKDDMQKYSIKDNVESHEGDLGGVVSPVKYMELEGTSVSNGSIDSLQTPFHSFTGQKSPREGQQLPLTDRNVDTEKPDTQSGHELDLKKEIQFGPVSSHSVKGLEDIGITDRDSRDQRSDVLTKNLLDHLQTGADRHSMKSCVEGITGIDQGYRQNMHPQNHSQEGGEGKNSGILLSEESRNEKLCSISSGHGETISQTHVPALQDNNGSASDNSERHEPGDQSQSHQSGDNMIGTDNIPCRNDPLKAPGEPEPLDIEVLHKVMRQEDHEEIPSDSTTVQTAGKNNDGVVPNTDKVDNLLSQEDMFENEPNDACVALFIKDNIQNYSPANNAEIYDGKNLADVVSPVKQMETEGKDAESRDMDSSQTLFHSFPSPNSSPPPSVAHKKAADEGSQLPVSDTKVDSGKSEAQYSSESGLKTETQPGPETPYSVTDSPYIGNTGGDSTDQGKDIVRQYLQDHPQGNACSNSVTSHMDQTYRQDMHPKNGGQDESKISGILSGESKDGNLYSHTSGYCTVISPTHVPALEGKDYSSSNTSERHDVIKAQQGIALLTPTLREESGGNGTGIESFKSIKLEPTDIELLVEEISQKLDLTLEHLPPTPPQKYKVDDYNPPPFDPLQSEFVKVSVIRSQSQSSIICLQSLHDNIPDAETDSDKPSSQRHSLKRRSASQDLFIPTKTQRSESIYQISPPPNVSDPEYSTEGSGNGEVAPVGLTHIQAPTGKANDAVGISCQSPAKDCTVPESSLMGTRQQLEGSHQWWEDQAVPDNIEGPKATTRQCHLVEQDALSLYDDRTTDSKRGATYEFSLNKHNENTAQRLEKFQQFPPDSATDTSSSTPSEDSVKSSSPRHHDHQTVPGSPRSSFRWRYAPSVDFDSVSVVHENMVDEDASLETCRPLPLVTCRRPLRVGLSRRHRAPPLHPNFRPPRRMHDV